MPKTKGNFNNPGQLKRAVADAKKPGYAPTSFTAKQAKAYKDMAPTTKPKTKQDAVKKAEAWGNVRAANRLHEANVIARAAKSKKK